MIRVFIVDDSAVAREALREALSSEPDITVIGVAQDPLFALPRMQKEWPDVVVLDIEMPRMSGLAFLRRLMESRPVPVVMCSSLGQREAQVTIDCLASGAVSVIEKPQNGLREFFSSAESPIVNAVREAAQSRVRKLGAPRMVAAKHSADALLSAPLTHALARTTDRIVAIGTSTGGTQALDLLLRELPVDVPGLVIVQHMPAAFTRAFAQRLDSISALDVSEAATGQRIMRGQALLAPGGKHLIVRRSGTHLFVEVVDGPPVNRHRPSVDVLFRSVAKAAGQNALGIIMTGMGDDGARGLKEMHDAGAYTVAQDEESSVVFGMPKEAMKLGGVSQTLDLSAIPEAIVRFST